MSQPNRGKPGTSQPNRGNRGGGQNKTRGSYKQKSPLQGQVLDGPERSSSAPPDLKEQQQVSQFKPDKYYGPPPEKLTTSAPPSVPIASQNSPNRVAPQAGTPSPKKPLTYNPNAVFQPPSYVSNMPMQVHPQQYVQRYPYAVHPHHSMTSPVKHPSPVGGSPVRSKAIAIIDPKTMAVVANEQPAEKPKQTVLQTPPTTPTKVILTSPATGQVVDLKSTPTKSLSASEILETQNQSSVHPEQPKQAPNTQNTEGSQAKVDKVDANPEVPASKSDNKVTLESPKAVLSEPLKKDTTEATDKAPTEGTETKPEQAAAGLKPVEEAAAKPTGQEATTLSTEQKDEVTKSTEEKEVAPKPEEHKEDVPKPEENKEAAPKPEEQKETVPKPEEQKEEGNKPAEQKEEGAQSTSTEAKTEQESSAAANDNKQPAAAEEEEEWERKDHVINTTADNTAENGVSLRPNAIPAVPVYPEGGWSPVNPEGKKKYDRDFLMKFAQFFNAKPPDLPENVSEIVVGVERKLGKSGDKWNNGPGSSPAGRRGGGRGGFGSSPRSDRYAKKGGGGGGGMRDSGSKRPIPKMSFPTNENAWVPPSKREVSAEQQETVVLTRKLTDTLNKLTADKFNLLSHKLADLLKTEVKSVEMLKEVISVIFEKALDEPNFCTMYAELCKYLNTQSPTFSVPGDGENAKPRQFTFKRILLNKCQEQFEKAKAAEAAEEAGLKAPQEKTKRRMFGNIIFIGELYKEKMLTDKIMHECVFRKLLRNIKNPAAEDIEALCKLMNTIGNVLDAPKAKILMDTYFDRMREMSVNPNVQARLQCLLLDVLELRSNNWRATSAANKKRVNVKTIATSSNVKKVLVKDLPAPAKPATRVATDEWETAGPKRNKQSSANYGPDSRGRGGRPTTSPARPQRGGARGAPNSGPVSQRGGRGGNRPGYSGDSQPNKPNAYAALKDDHSPLHDRRGGKPAHQPSNELMQIVSALYTTKDLDTAVGSIQELSASELSAAVAKLVQLAIEKDNDDATYLCNQVLRALKEEKTISTSQAETGFSMVIRSLEDLTKTVSSAAAHFGKVLGNAVLDGCISWPFLVTPVSTAFKAADIIGATFGVLKEEEGVAGIKAKLREHKFDLLKMFVNPDGTLNEDGVTRWIETHHLKGIVELPAASSLSGEGSTKNIASEVASMLQNNKPSADISAFIDRSPKKETESNEFVRGIAFVLLAHVVSSAGAEKSKEETLFIDYSGVLQNLLSENTDKQLQCLFGVQQYCNENQFPKGLLGRVFKYLYETESVGKDAFVKWSADTSTENGKETASAEANKFILSLDEEPFDSDGDD
eukprot:TRINITY_DN1545_c0_g1_i1.p1 TRINITY_DN1545_c0_g1~~TRINITY_DN1545_c0_g1_i1.p1  ORF type:complete len:1326 (+),score=322.33 TRINITY_DN1545_c0_g1_i1:99-4076(+)